MFREPKTKINVKKFIPFDDKSTMRHTTWDSNLILSSSEIKNIRDRKKL
jgi:hypothetical protein